MELLDVRSAILKLAHLVRTLWLPLTKMMFVVVLKDYPLTNMDIASHATFKAVRDVLVHLIRSAKSVIQNLGLSLPLLLENVNALMLLK